MSYEVTGTTPGAPTVPPGDVTWDASKKPKRWPWIVGIVAALLVGGAIGASGQSTKTTTETQTRTVTSIVTRNVASTPQACKDALDTADQAFAGVSDFATHVGAAMQASSDAFTAISNSDVTGLEAATTEMNDITPKLQADTDKMTPLISQYHSARDECNAS